MQVQIENSWKLFLEHEFNKTYFEGLVSFVKSQYSTQTVYPSPANIFRAFNSLPVDKVKVVILGQDPYHTPGVADGLAFSTLKGNKVPPSLQNIYKEINDEFSDGFGPDSANRINYSNYNNPDLTRWALQGVLLLNTSLTVRKGEPASHSKVGWQIFTDAVITELGKIDRPLVFILWGSHARNKKTLIQSSSNHLILESAHPSPFSVHNGFFGNNHFKLCNQFLKEHGLESIDWN